MRCRGGRTPGGRDAVLTAIEQARASHADTAALATIIPGVADAAARRELEALMASPKFRSTFVDGLMQQGEQKGIEKGREEGAVTSKVEDLIKVIRARGLELTKAQRALVTSCADLTQLAAWFDQALDAKTTDEIFGTH
jgi:predicted transposase YdaD